MREADAGIARGALDDGAARPQQAAARHRARCRERRAVLDRLAGVEELRLAPDLAAGGIGNPVEADQRGVADGGDDISLERMVDPGVRHCRKLRNPPADVDAPGVESLTLRHRIEDAEIG
jgi:hypothetical protein